MIDIIVRSKRDSDAVKAMINRFYSEWGIEIHTLHGSRTVDRALDELENIITSGKFYVILLGREDVELASKLDKQLPPNAVVHVVPRARVRNTRIEHLAYEFSIARSRVRLYIKWSPIDSVYLVNSRDGVFLKDYEYNPAYDIFMFIGEPVGGFLENIIGRKVCTNPLLQRRFGGLHKVYCGDECVAELHIPDEGLKPIGRFLKEYRIDYKDVDRMVRANSSVLELFENISKQFLRKYSGWVDTVVIPWSGGKDSTLTLYLALEVFPRDKVRVVYVDTGVEFPQTIEFIEEISRRLGVEVCRVYAGIDKAIASGEKPLPTHSNRWCTELKIKAIEKAIEEIAYGNTLIITGDREVESRARSIRPPARREGEAVVVTPIRLWSTLHVQLYTLLKKIPQNPLYLHGFYRIGCYICPALRSWELYIMTRDKEIIEKLENKPLYKKFIRHREKASSN